MCGIAGFCGRGDRGDLLKMAGHLVHRGPDAEGFFEDASRGLWLGHRRLSIVDLADGAQPMSTSDGDLTIVFNGEIYNHKELRKELQHAGFHFTTDHSDTEVLLHGYAKWGRELLYRLNGMWAFAIYDRRKNRIFAARDRFGKKPFYYFHQKGTFAFASELTSLLAHPESPRSVSVNAIRKLFAYCLIPAPWSMIEGVWKLPAGHWLEYSPESDSLTVKMWWEYLSEPNPELLTRSENSLAGELRELLRRSVARRLVADVPVGVFLSGGIDSTTIAALAAQESGNGGLHTFCIGFEEPSFDESSYAAAAANALGTQHYCRTLSLEESRKKLPQLLQRLDEPVGDNSILPTWELCGFAREHVTVALGGDGGDELLAGYDPFRALRPAGIYHSLIPGGVHRVFQHLAGLIPVSQKNISLDFKIKRFLRGLSYQTSCWLPAWMGALEPSDIADALGGSLNPCEIYSEAIDAWDRQKDLCPIDRATSFFIRIYLQDGILTKVDRASMLHSLEVRSPFLDIEVVDFLRQLPAAWKFRQGKGKYLLHLAAQGLVPDSVLKRKKKGFGSPVGPWFQNGKLALDPGSPEWIKSLEQAHQSGRSDQRLALWSALSLQEWKKGVHPRIEKEA